MQNLVHRHVHLDHPDRGLWRDEARDVQKLFGRKFEELGMTVNFLFHRQLHDHLPKSPCLFNSPVRLFRAEIGGHPSARSEAID
jgi:hypothetical protein